MPEEKLYNYEVTCAGGLEDVLIDELRDVLGKRIAGLRDERGEVGRIFFQYEGSPRRLLELECAAGIAVILAQMHDVTVGQPGLQRISQGLSGLPLAAMGRLAKLVDADVDTKGYRLRVSQRGSHRFDAGETEFAVAAALAAGQLTPSHSGFDLEFRLQKRRAQLKLALRYGSHAGPVEQRGMPAPMISAIVRMLGLDDTDDLLLINSQRDAAAAAQRICGGQVTCLRPVRPGAGTAGALTDVHSMVIGSADHLPLQPGSMTAAILVSCEDETATPGLAAGRLSQVVSGVAGEGVIAVLVPSSEGFAARLPHWGLPVEVIGAMPVYVRRRRWALFLLSRLDLLQLV